VIVALSRAFEHNNENVFSRKTQNFVSLKILQDVE